MDDHTEFFVINEHVIRLIIEYKLIIKGEKEGIEAASQSGIDTQSV